MSSDLSYPSLQASHSSLICFSFSSSGQWITTNHQRTWFGSSKHCSEQMGMVFMNTSLAFLSELELLLELLSLLDPASTASKRYRSSVSSASISHSSSSTRYWCIDCAAKIPQLFITIKLTKVAAHALFYNYFCVAVGPYSHDMSNEHVIQCKYDITKRLNIWTLGMFQTWSCIEKTQL